VAEIVIYEVFHSPLVTSNLAFTPTIARSWTSRTERSQPRLRGPKSLVFKILTSKLVAIRILQTLFVNPAPSKGFKDQGGGGYPPKAPMSAKPKTRRTNYFAKKSTTTNPRQAPNLTEKACCHPRRLMTRRLTANDQRLTTNDRPFTLPPTQPAPERRLPSLAAPVAAGNGRGATASSRPAASTPDSPGHV
jgi:hypothetical protein